MYSEAALAGMNTPLASTSLTHSDGTKCLAARYINRMTVEAFYQIYTMWASGQGLPEDDVAKATCGEDRSKLEAAQKSHLLNVQQYRLIQNRLNTLSETEGSNILKIDLDGLDQSKTKFPRNLASSKQLVLEGYVILEPDIAKDSSCEATLVMKAIDWVEDFVDVIKNHFTPIRNRVMKVELMQGSLDIGGLVHTGHDVADANHCWRVTVASAPLADPAQPKKRGRPPKRKDETIAPKEGEQIFGPMSKRRSQVVPPIDAVVPVDLFGASGAPSGAPPEKVAWPTRATFAERKKPGGEEAAMVFETRRSKFYESVPSDLWRDGLESDWNECVKCGSEGEA
ncbi:Uncharacterized protein SCF082_LOCUS34414, partial [Durusdinium trenchii]